VNAHPIGTELGKLASVRSTWALVAAAGALSGLSAVGFLAVGRPAGMDDLATEAGQRIVLHSSATGSVLALVLGVLLFAGEYRHGSITDTYLSTPRRGTVVLAKLAAGLAFGVLIGVAAGVVTLAVAVPWLAAKGHPVDPGAGYLWRTMLGTVLWCAGYAAIGVAVGALLRNLVLAVTAGLAWLFVAEPIVGRLVADLERWLPSSAAASAGYAPDADLPQAGGVLALVLYAGALAGLAARTTVRRDVT
jgi:ABC-2 type transport system permease protein